jgi:hypothetical protein
MIIIKIQGGLGNQMFQFALGQNLLEKTKEQVKFDLSGLDTPKEETKRFFELDKFDIKIPTASVSDVNFFTQEKKHPILTKIKRLFGIKVPSYIIDTHSFNKEVFRITGDAYLDGYWQTEKYFPNDKEVVRKAFVPHFPLSKIANEIADKIDNSSVSIHIRRGDYITNKKVANVIGSCGLSYYKKALSMATENFTNPKIFVFTDDIDWVKENLKTYNSIFFISEKDNGLEDWEEIILMSKCKRHVLSNSSFSWWGAWLDSREDKMVIAPKQWFKNPKFENKDITPSSWIQI